MTLNLGEFRGCAAFFVVVHVIFFGPGAIESYFRVRAGIPCAGTVHFRQEFVWGHLRYTAPPFITNFTCCKTLMSCNGSPGTAITSAR